MNNQNFSNGTNRLTEEYLNVSQGESVFLYVDSRLSQESKALARRLQHEIQQKYSCDMAVEGELDPDKISHNYDAYIFAGGVRSHAKQQAIALKKMGKKVIRIFDFGVELFATCLQPSQVDIMKLNQALLSRVNETRKITIKGANGTDLVVDIDPQYLWTDSHGSPHENFPGVLPAGEVNTYPMNVNGTLVAGGALNANLGLPCSPILHEGDLRFDIRDGEIVKWDCKKPALKLALHTLFSIDNAKRVGELGLGTNIGVKEFVPFVSHINERHPGPHFGFGTPTQASSKVDWSCPSHIDVMIPTCCVYFDDVLVYDGHRYCLDTDDISRARPHEVFYVDAV